MTDNSVDIRALAKLARLDITDEEVVTLEKELPSILGFVDTIQKADISNEIVQPEVRNVMRDDTDGIESGIHTEILLNAAPERTGDYVAVKQVITRKNN
ncbi:MAG: glutamyl-tRNA(Gln) and/or aspartyl-tRNA(Asn) amidotransferase subunit [Candidatus Kaiserbacteria bacterium]|nr:glutamyl-tRNA(Gln) and/or aspartyl-tRNA(Asn) amidotransferase subunit [Candidatus Kaiserbacteria bacterium]